ncbi:hypothetical protein ACRAKI_20950 [Saccharothrix isguenensis]
MAGLSVTWNLTGPGWADIVTADHRAEAEVTASCITAAPEDLLTAVPRLVLGENETRAQFEAEPTCGSGCSNCPMVASTTMPAPRSGRVSRPSTPSHGR